MSAKRTASNTHAPPLAAKRTPQRSDDAEDADDDADDAGGYPRDLIEGDINHVMLCSICHEVARDAMQCVEQHVFCNSCICRAIQMGKNQCPVCRKPVMNKLNPARAVREMIGKLCLRCRFYKRGCSEKPIIESREAHHASCAHRDFPCLFRGCAFKAHGAGADERLAAHKAVCPAAEVACDVCDMRLTRGEVPAHKCFSAMRAAVAELAAQVAGLATGLIHVKAALPEDVALRAAAPVACDVQHARSQNVMSDERGLVLETDGPKLVRSVAFTPSTATEPLGWAFQVRCLNMSMEFGMLPLSHTASGGDVLHNNRTGRAVGAHSSATSGSMLNEQFAVRSGVTVACIYNPATQHLVIVVDGDVVLRLNVPAYEEGEQACLVATLWNGSRLEPVAVIKAFPVAAVSTRALAPTAMATSRSDPCECAVHDDGGDSRQARICTTCFKCTAYGDRCFLTFGCAGVQRSGERCGCGNGKSGCIRCGRCSQCCCSHVPLTANALDNFMRVRAKERAQTN